MQSATALPVLGPANPDRLRLAVRGSAWSAFGYLGTQLLRTSATLVLARMLLGPEPFGLVGLVAVFLAGLGMFSEVGIAVNIVQHRRGDDPLFLNTAFSIQAARGLAIWTVAAMAAYPLAQFYDQPQLLPLLMVAALAEVFRGLSSTAACAMTRRLDLQSVTLLAIGSELVGACVAIAWAMIAPSAWALVARTIAAAAVYAAGSHCIAAPKVSFGWDRAAAKDIFSFGGWISIATATYFLGSQGERLILGKFITPAELGCFSLAVMISSVPAAGINQLIGQIFLPLIADTVRNSATETVRQFRSARGVFCSAAWITGVGVLACAEPFVNLVFPPRFQMTGWMLQLLGIRVAFDIFAAPASTLLVACGKSKYSAAANTTRLVLIVCGVWVSFVKFGVYGAVFSLLAAQALSYFPVISGMARVLPGTGRAELLWYLAFLASLSVSALIVVQSRGVE